MSVGGMNSLQTLKLNNNQFMQQCASFPIGSSNLTTCNLATITTAYPCCRYSGPCAMDASLTCPLPTTFYPTPPDCCGYMPSIVQLDNGQVAWAANSQVNTRYGYTCYVRLLDRDGNQLWMKQIVSTGACQRIQVAKTVSNGFFTVWQQQATNGGIEIWGQYFTTEENPATPTVPFRVSAAATTSDALWVMPRVAYVSGPTPYLLVSWALYAVPGGQIYMRAVSPDSSVGAIGSPQVLSSTASSRTVYRPTVMAPPNANGYAVVWWSVTQPTLGNGGVGYWGRYVVWSGSDISPSGSEVYFFSAYQAQDAYSNWDRNGLTLIPLPDSTLYEAVWITRLYNVTLGAYISGTRRVSVGDYPWNPSNPLPASSTVYTAYKESSSDPVPDNPTGYGYISENGEPAFVLFWESNDLIFLNTALSSINIGTMVVYPNLPVDGDATYYAATYYNATRLAVIPRYTSSTGTEYLMTYFGSNLLTPTTWNLAFEVKTQGSPTYPVVPPPPTPPAPKKSVWWVALIIIGILLVAGLAGLGVWYFIFHQRTDSPSDADMLKNQQELLAAHHASHLSSGENAP